MRANKWFRSLSKSQQVCLIALINALLMMVSLCGSGTAKMYIDSESYFKAWDNLCAGKLDLLRTPVYPIFVGVIRALVGAKFASAAIVIIQYLIMVLAACCFYKIALYLCRSTRIAYAVAIVFILSQWFIGYSQYMLTESLSVSGSIFLIYSVCKIYYENSRWHVLGFLWWTLFLIFIRPSFVYILPVFLVFWLLLSFTSRIKWKMAIGCLAAILISSASLLLYMYKFQQTYGVFSISIVSTFNQYVLAREGGYLDEKQTTNAELSNYVRDRKVESQPQKAQMLQDMYNPDNHTSALHTINDLYVTEFWAAVELYGYPAVKELVSNSMATNHRTVLMGMFKRLFFWANQPFNQILPSLQFRLIGFIVLPIAAIFYIFVQFKLLYLLLVVSCIIILYWLIKKRKIPYFFLLLFMLGTSSLIVTFAGAQAEYPRLMTPSIPIYMLMLAQLLSLLSVNAASIRKSGRGLK